jgi:putative transposase
MNAFALLRLLPMSDRDKDVESLALRHQITMLERRLRKQKVRSTRATERSYTLIILNQPANVYSSGNFLKKERTMWV